jgi:hypothetical protein
MDSLLEHNRVELDITKQDCASNKSKFYECVSKEKNELTKTFTNEDWRNYDSAVLKVQFNCYEQNNLVKCKAFYTFQDISY